MKKYLVLATIMLAAYTVSAQKYNGSSATILAEQKLNDEYCTGMFKSADGVIFDIANNVTTSGYLNILNWLPGRVAGL